MRVGIPSDNGVNIAAHTGRAQGFLVFDCEDKKAVRVEYRTNEYTPHAKGECTGEGGHEHEHHHHNHSHDDLLGALHDCQVMIARGMGPRLVMDLTRRNIRVLFCDEDDAERAATDFAIGKLASTGKSGCDHHGC
jgi:predicted Fe-Mo cluster-binding NifX family protein